jgi:hypothetical protein
MPDSQTRPPGQHSEMRLCRAGIVRSRTRSMPARSVRVAVSGGRRLTSFRGRGRVVTGRYMEIARQNAKRFGR